MPPQTHGIGRSCAARRVPRSLPAAVRDGVPSQAPESDLAPPPWGPVARCMTRVNAICASSVASVASPASQAASIRAACKRPQTSGPPGLPLQGPRPAGATDRSLPPRMQPPEDCQGLHPYATPVRDSMSVRASSRASLQRPRSRAVSARSLTSRRAVQVEVEIACQVRDRVWIAVHEFVAPRVRAASTRLMSARTMSSSSLAAFARRRLSSRVAHPDRVRCRSA